MALFTLYINSKYITFFFFLILNKMRARNGKKMQEISRTTHIWSVVKREQETTETILAVKIRMSVPGAGCVCGEVIQPISTLFFLTVN